MMLIFGSIGWFCALRLAARLENLVNHIHHISLGELDKDLNMNSRDEFGRLLEAVRRMQASLIFAERRLHHESNDHRQAA
jgi:HAMP domain-containing protein